ncbi:MAG: type II toxin-antitoxin system HicB family antitoxin [Acidobacteria bacterium]|nr:MAG: type II toxin-antitoxin system HicB family antitoxin [Acidobacteriota bacterium]
MNPESRYLKIVEWSDEDACFIGSCPELFYGGCHGEDERQVFDQLCAIVKETVELYERDGKPLPKPLSGKDLVNCLQKIA